MSDDLQRMVGQIDGKLDSLISSFDKYISFHNDRHEKIDASISSIQADMNQAKGAKGAILWTASLVSALVGAVAAVISKHWGQS